MAKNKGKAKIMENATRRAELMTSLDKLWYKAQAKKTNNSKDRKRITKTEKKLKRKVNKAIKKLNSRIGDDLAVTAFLNIEVLEVAVFDNSKQCV